MPRARRLGLFATATVALALASGCRSETTPVATAPSPRAVTLEFLGDLVLPPSPDLGGLSAILFTPETGRWLALSDAKAEPRAFELDVSIELDDAGTARFAVEPVRRVALSGAPAEALDPEGMAASPWGTLFVSSEANLSARSHDQPRLLEFDRDGRWLGSLDVPEKFLAGSAHGVRHNLGFEGLTVAPDGKLLFLGAESALVQDGPAAGLHEVGFSRIVVYAVDEGSLAAGPEYVYPVGPIAEANGLEDVEAMGGLVELAALSSSRLLVLERIFIRERAEAGRHVTRVRLYDVDLTGATDVSAMESLGETDAWRPVTKELVLDFDDIVPRLSPEHPVLDNFEAMGFGPTLADGSRSLVVVSDDNFRDEQRTVFLFFSLKGASLFSRSRARERVGTAPSPDGAQRSPATSGLRRPSSSS